MSTEINVPEDVKELVNKIIARNNLDSTSNVTYNVGSELGDGFMSKTLSVDIDSQKEDLHLFVKYTLNTKYMEAMGLNKIYDNEIHFYEVIVPAYMEFLKEKGMKNSFRNVPRCYGTSDGIVILENLKKKGYELCDKELIANDEHITLVFKTYAKFHATSFALQDQKPEEYQKMLADVTDIYRSNVNKEMAERHVESTRNEINNFLKQLDPVKDKFIFDRSGRLADDMIEFASSLRDIAYKNAVLIQGDSWCNNMMFMYKDDKAVPNDVMLIDWQIIRQASPVFDLSYFFYTAAASSKKTLRKLDHFLSIYHEELSEQMSEMGSDVKKIYSYSTFEAEWKQFCRFGYLMAFFVLKAMLSTKDQLSDFDQKLIDNSTIMEAFSNMGRKDVLTERLRNLTMHLFLNEFL